MSWSLIIEILTGSEINEDLHGGVEISLGTPIGSLNKMIQNESDCLASQEQKDPYFGPWQNIWA